MQIIIILTYEFYIYIYICICGGKKAGAKLFGYKPLKKDFLRIHNTYKYILYIFYPHYCAIRWQIYLFSYPTVFIYIYICVWVHVCARASVFFFSIYRLQEIESDFVCVHARPLRPIKRNTIFST